MIKTITLSPEATQKLRQIDGSIQHWSVEHAKLVISATNLQKTISDLYDGRNQLLIRTRQESGITDDMVLENSLTPGPDGSVVLVVNVKDEVPPAENAETSSS